MPVELYPQAVRAKLDSLLVSLILKAERERERIHTEEVEEIAEMARQIEETLTHERDEVLTSVRESLIDVVTASTRSVLDEGFTPAEQRSMIQDAILASVGDLENVTLQ
jgi:F0F1-type ATP synthase membrane subunit b/b'